MLLRDYFLGSLRDAFRNRGPLSPSQITTSMGSTIFFFSLSSALVHLTKKTITAIPCCWEKVHQCKIWRMDLRRSDLAPYGGGAVKLEL
jgi:hypothetical protein